MVVFCEEHGPWKFLICSCEFKAYQKKEEVYIYERAREGERERENEKEREREKGWEREREKEKHFCGTVLFLGIRNFWGRKMDIFWMPHWKLFGSENETEDPETQRPKDPETQRLGDKHFCGTVLCVGIEFFDPKMEFLGSEN